MRQLERAPEQGRGHWSPQVRARTDGPLPDSVTGIPYVTVVGSGTAEGDLYEEAREVGKLVAERGGTVVCGGLSGVMEAAACGSTEAGGVAVGILPDEDRQRQNGYLTYSVATGAGQARNLAVVCSGDGGHRRRRRVRDALGDRACQKGRTARGGTRRLGSQRARVRGDVAAGGRRGGVRPYR